MIADVAASALMSPSILVGLGFAQRILIRRLPVIALVMPRTGIVVPLTTMTRTNNGH